MSRDPVLQVHSVSKRFGGFQALERVSLRVGEGEIVGLVGPNGSGKTTLLNIISGLYPPDGGYVSVRSERVVRPSLHRMARMGVNRTFQVPKPFRGMTVRENLKVAALHSRRRGKTEGQLLEFAGLSDAADRDAATLNSAQQKMLDLARALATGPLVLLADELGAGLNPKELSEVADRLRLLASEGMAIVVVEHLLGFVHRLTERVLVLNAGREIFEGSLSAAAEDPGVIEVYLGG